MPTLRELRAEAKWRGLTMVTSIVSGLEEQAIWSPSERRYVIRIAFASTKTVANAALMAALETVPLTKEGRVARNAARNRLRDRRKRRA